MVKEGLVECDTCEVIMEVMLDDDVQNHEFVGGTCPECGDTGSLFAIIPEDGE